MNHTLSNSSDLDGLVKFLLAVIIAMLPFYFEKQISYALFMLYLLLITRASGIQYQALLLSAVSYGVIVLFPYLFGIAMNLMLYYLTKNQAFIAHQQTQEVTLRLFRLFIIWYVSILYFHTTPVHTILGLLDKLLSPLQLIRVPVRDYLKVVMCIVMDLKGSGEDMKARFLDHARSVIGGNRHKLKAKFNGISQVIVASLVDSFQKLDSMETWVEKTSSEELFAYRFRMTRLEGIAAASISVLILMLYWIEKGNGFFI